MSFEGHLAPRGLQLGLRVVFPGRELERLKVLVTQGCRYLVPAACSGPSRLLAALRL